MKKHWAFIYLFTILLLSSCQFAANPDKNGPEKESFSKSVTSKSALCSITELTPVLPEAISPKYVFEEDVTGNGEVNKVEIYYYKMGEHRTGTDDADLVYHLPEYENTEYNFIRFTANQKIYTAALYWDNDIFGWDVFLLETNAEKPVLILNCWNGRAGILLKAFLFDVNVGITELPFPYLNPDKFMVGYSAQMEFLDGFRLRAKCVETGLEEILDFGPECLIFFSAENIYDGDKVRVQNIIYDGIGAATVCDAVDENGQSGFLLRQTIHAGQFPYAQFGYLQTYITWDECYELIILKQEWIPCLDDTGGF